jgi:hypothetical protein
VLSGAELQTSFGVFKTAMSAKPVRQPVPKWPPTPMVRLGFIPKGEIQRCGVEPVQRSDLVAEVGLPADEFALPADYPLTDVSFPNRSMMFLSTSSRLRGGLHVSQYEPVC